VTPEQIRLVQQSSIELVARSDEWSAHFYHHLLLDRPDLRAMFTDDLTAQRAKFSAEIAALLDLVVDLDGFEARAGRLGATHVAYGVRAAHYRSSGSALIASVHDVLGDAAGDDVLAAWRALHDLVAESMQAGAATRPP
jgi:nitric oxide dioxygenase